MAVFGLCILLFSLNLNNFNTSLVTNMEKKFYVCNSLVSLNLSSFDISKVTNMKFMFYDCTSLIFLNLQNFNEINDKNLEVTNMFYNINIRLIYCLNIDKNQNIRGELEKANILSNNNNVCTDSCFTENMKLSISIGSCITNCGYSNNNEIFEYNNICYSKCPENTYISPYNEYLCLKIKNCEKLNKYHNYDDVLIMFHKVIIIILS